MITTQISYFLYRLCYSVYNRFISKDTNVNTVEFEKSMLDSVNIFRLDVAFDNDSLIIRRDSRFSKFFFVQIFDSIENLYESGFSRIIDAFGLKNVTVKIALSQPCLFP